MSRAGILLVCALAALPVAARARHTDEGKGQETGSKLHTPDEILAIMEKSSIRYEIAIDNTLPEPAPESPRVLSSQQVLKEGKDGYDLTVQTISKEATGFLESGEAAFKKGDYDAALVSFKKVLEIDPDYSYAFTLIGDVFYDKGDYEQARSRFREAIDRNFADYDAHWFLADADWKLDDKSQAIQEMTIAHLLNVNHKTMKSVLLQYRDQIGRPWKDWDYSPRIALRRDGKKVEVKAQEDWIGYAMVRAVWEYEPGYAESVAGPDYKQKIINMAEEKEALLAVLSGPKSPQQIARIVDNGFVDEFIYYEVLGRRAPAALVLLPRDLFMRLVQYVDTYH